MQGADLLQAAELRDELGEGSDDESGSEGGDSDLEMGDSGDDVSIEGLSDVEEGEEGEESGSDDEGAEEGSEGGSEDEGMEEDGSDSEGAGEGSEDEGIARTAVAAKSTAAKPSLAKPSPAPLGATTRKRSRDAAEVDEAEEAVVSASGDVEVAQGEDVEGGKSGSKAEDSAEWGDYLPPPPTKRRRAASPKGSSGRCDHLLPAVFACGWLCAHVPLLFVLWARKDLISSSITADLYSSGIHSKCAW